MATQDVIVINEGFQERRRTTSAGTKSRYTLTVTAEPIIHDFSEEKLGEGPAMAIRDAITKQIKAITEVVKLSTLKRREQSKDALARGVPSAVARYSGGRTGAKAPSGSVRFGNDSGRLAEGIFVRQNTAEKNWTIKVPANRLDPSTFKVYGDFLAMVERLRAHVPVLANPFGDRDVAKAIEKGIGEVLIRALKKGEDLRAARAKAAMGLVRQALSLF